MSSSLRVFHFLLFFFSRLQETVNMEGPEVTFLFQFGNLRDMVTVPASTINLKTLKDLACDFINSKVCNEMEILNKLFV